MGLIKKIQAMACEMTRWRQKLHGEPELAFQERKTARLIVRTLEASGIKTHSMAKTGVIGVLHGRGGPPLPGHKKKAIMLRADMDALPIQEETGLIYKSRKPGVMHACGHDGHIAMLLGAAKHLAETKEFDGTIYFVFQPAEEHLGGAEQMIKEGLFQKFDIDEVYGMHNYPALPLGMMASMSGPMLAGNDDFTVVFKGEGGHTSRPENTADVVGAAAEAIMAIKCLAAKEIQPGDTATLAVCALHTSSEADNVLPNAATFNGSIRSFDPALHKRLKAGMEKIIEDISDKYGAEAEFVYTPGYPVLVNSKTETDFAVDVAKDTVGDQKVLTAIPRTLGVEDFAFYLQEKPGNFIALGTGRADGKPTADIHTAKYDFNDAALPVGASYWVNLAQKALPLFPPRPPATQNDNPAQPPKPPGRSN